MPRPDVSEERRSQIIDAAIQVFSRAGYSKASMPAVAREAGLSVGGMYWYFKSKDEIVAALLERAFAADFDVLVHLLDAETSAAERLWAFVNNYVASFAERQRLNTISIEFYSAAMHDEKVRCVILRYVEHYRLALAALIEQGIQRGEFRPINPGTAATALLGMEEGLSLLLAVDPQGTRWRESFLLGCELIIAGLIATPQP